LSTAVSDVDSPFKAVSLWVVADFVGSEALRQCSKDAMQRCLQTGFNDSKKNIDEAEKFASQVAHGIKKAYESIAYPKDLRDQLVDALWDPRLAAHRVIELQSSSTLSYEFVKTLQSLPVGALVDMTEQLFHNGGKWRT